MAPLTTFHYQKNKDIPVWMSHETSIGFLHMTWLKIADTLHTYSANIEFYRQENIGHWGWNSVNSDSSTIIWLMSWTNPQTPKK